MKLRDRSISKYEVDTLFRDVLNQDQIENMAIFLKLVGTYVFIDREMLDILSEQHFGKKIGLSYLQRAVNHNLVSEIQTEGEYEKFYFQLKSGGVSFLHQISHPYRTLPLDAARKEREEILAINQFLINNSYFLDLKAHHSLYGPFIIDHEIVLYRGMSESEIVEVMMQHTRTKTREIIEQRYDFREMYLKFDKTLGNKAKGNETSHL